MGPAAIALATPPRDFYQERFRYVSALDGVPTQDDLIQTIKSGRRFGEMPANPQLTDAEILTLTNYILEVHRLGWVDTLTLEFADDEDTTPEEIEEISQARITPLEPISVSGPERGFESDTQRGRTQYLASCASCHGPWGLGDGLDMPLDEQGKPIEVRDLTSGRFRSGAAIEEVFKRIRCGIPGTPMSAALDLTDEEVWQLVYYVRFLAKRSR